MKLIAEYLEQAEQFERMATAETDKQFKNALLKQAADYRKLAERRAKELNVALPPQSN